MAKIFKMPAKPEGDQRIKNELMFIEAMDDWPEGPMKERMVNERLNNIERIEALIAKANEDAN